MGRLCRWDDLFPLTLLPRSRYEEGVDAIVKAGPILTGLGELDAALDERTHPLLGRGSVHASLIEGGAEMSSYPGRCTIGLERNAAVEMLQ